MIKFIKKYPRSTGFAAALVVFGLIFVLSNSGVVKFIALAGFVADIVHLAIVGAED